MLKNVLHIELLGYKKIDQEPLQKAARFAGPPCRTLVLPASAHLASGMLSDALKINAPDKMISAVLRASARPLGNPSCFNWLGAQDEFIFIDSITSIQRIETKRHVMSRNAIYAPRVAGISMCIVREYACELGIFACRCHNATAKMRAFGLLLRVASNMATMNQAHGVG
jgi:hypothetical protein